MYQSPTSAVLVVLARLADHGWLPQSLTLHGDADDRVFKLRCDDAELRGYIRKPPAIRHATWCLLVWLQSPARLTPAHGPFLVTKSTDRTIDFKALLQFIAEHR